MGARLVSSSMHVCPVMEKDPAPFAAPGGIHRGVGHASMAKEISVCWPFNGTRMCSRQTPQ
jgi:hypothetical protein